MGEAVQRYATVGRLYLAAPLLADHPSILSESDVAKELSCVIGFEREPNAELSGKHWKRAPRDAPKNVDFTKEAQLLLGYLEQAPRGTDVFCPVFEARSLEAIAATTSISNETLGEIERTLVSLAGLINSTCGEITRIFSHAKPTIQGQIADFTTFIEDRSQVFVGRQFVFDAFDEFTANKDCATSWFLAIQELESRLFPLN